MTPDVSNSPDSSVGQGMKGIFSLFKRCCKSLYKWLFLTPFISCLIKINNSNLSWPQQHTHTHSADCGKPATSLYISPRRFIVYSNGRRENSGCMRNVLWQLGQFIWLIEASRWWWMVPPASSYIFTAVRWKLRHKQEKKESSCYNVCKSKNSKTCEVLCARVMKTLIQIDKYISGFTMKRVLN